MPSEQSRGEYSISTDASRLDLAVIQEFLSTSYWAAGRSRETVEQSIAHSLAVGVYRGQAQVGFGRVITDYATFAYLADVFILPPCRRQGLGTWLIDVIVEHPELRMVRRWLLATRDARGLYEKSGFRQLANPSYFMERRLD